MTRHLYCLLLFLIICRDGILALEPIAKPCSKVEIDKRIQQLLPTEGFTKNDIGKHGAFFRYVCEPDYTRTDEDGEGHFECLSTFTGRCSPISLETHNPFLQIGAAANGKVDCLIGPYSTSFALPCGDVPVIEHGTVSDGKSCIGSKRSIECNSDFRLVGSETIECGIDTKWRVRGYCQENICGDEPMVQNGFISSGSYYIGAERQLGCFDGFLLQGSSLVTCNSEAKWLIGGYCDRDVLPIDCEDLHLRKPLLPSGVYSISSAPVSVYCDMDYLEGGWTVFQRRVDGSQDFFLKWADYKKGFGDLTANFWLGNDNIHALTSGKYEYNLLIALEAKNGSTGYALYDGFRIEDEANFYTLRFRSFKVNGGIGDSLHYQKDMKFSTIDADNDKDSGSCASQYSGAWWYNACEWSNLNGVYGSTTFGKGVLWHSWRGLTESMKTAAMMIRRSPLLLPVDCEAIHSADTSLPSGVYTIYPPDLPSVAVYCDMTYLGGGWTVFQRRVDGSQDFLLKWADYKKSFGNLSANFWLGNDNIHAITSGKYEYNLLIALTANNGSMGYALYDGFRIEDEANFYTLRFRSFKVNGGIGDSLSYQHKNMKFSTVDADNDIDSTRNCAITFTGAWWYGACHGSNLNGLYGNTEYGKGLNWAAWLWLYESMKTTAMMIRRSPL